MDDAPPPPPERFTRGKVLGEGGLGRVVSYYDRRLGREVARKELLSPTPTDRLRFWREARITAQLEHPSIVPVHDASESRGTPHYTMKSLHGRTLEDAIHDRVTLSDRLALLDHLEDVCQAVAYAHGNGVIHRDLKPANVMLGEFGETWVVDWGLARAIDEEDQPDPDAPDHGALDARLTQAGAVLGTPAWMSPEQARGAPASPASDVWSLGAMLFAVLAGRPPFEGSVAQVLDAVASGEVPALPEEVPPELDAIVRRAMRPEPAERYGSAGELAGELKAWAAGRRVHAYSYGPAAAARVLLRNYRLPLTVGGAMLAVLAMSAAAAGTRVRAERDHAVSAENSMHLALGRALTQRAVALADASDLHSAEIVAATSLTHAEDPQARGVLARVRAQWRPAFLERLPEPLGCHSLVALSGGAVLCAGDGGVSRHDPAGLRWRDPDPASTVVPSPDELRLAVTDEEGVRVLDALTGETLRTQDAEASWWAGWSPEGELIWADWNQLRGDRGVVGPEVCQGSTIRSGDWSGSGHLALGCVAGRAGVIDFATRERVSTFASREASYAVLFESPDVLAVSSGQRVQRWRASDGTTLDPMEGADGFVVRLARAPRGWVAGGSDRGTVALWNGGGPPVAALTGHGSPMSSAAFSAAGDRMWTAGGAPDIRAWTLPTQQAPLRTRRGVGALAADLDGDWVAARDGRRRVWLWRRSTGVQIPAPDLPEARTLGAVNGKLAIYHGRSVVLLTVGEEAVVVSRVQIDPPLTDTKIAGGHLFGVADGVLHVIDPATGDATTWTPPEQDLDVIGQGPDALVRSGRTLFLLRPSPLREVGHHVLEQVPRVAAASSDGVWLAWGTGGSEAHLTHRLTGEMRTLTGHTHRVSTLVFAGGLLVSGSWDHTLHCAWRAPRSWDPRPSPNMRPARSSGQPEPRGGHGEPGRAGLPRGMRARRSWGSQLMARAHCIGRFGRAPADLLTDYADASWYHWGVMVPDLPPPLHYLDVVLTSAIPVPGSSPRPRRPASPRETP